MRRVLVTGATGKQGRGFIKAACADEDGSADFNFLTLSRNIESAAAKSLSSISERVSLVRGDLSDPESIEKILKDASESQEGAIWGVFAVLAYPGLGKDASEEERQGTVSVKLKAGNKVSLIG